MAVASSMYFGIYLNKSGLEIAFGLFLGEISHPFLHLRIFLKNKNLRHSLAYEVAEVVYIALFMTMRMTVGVCIVIYIWLCLETHPVITYSVTFLACQSAVFTIRMVKILNR